MTGEQERRTLIIPGWVGFTLFVALILGACAGLVYWLAVVPSTNERATFCPRHEQRAEAYRALAEVRPLRDYELAGWTTSDEYVRRWCR